MKLDKGVEMDLSPELDRIKKLQFEAIRVRKEVAELEKTIKPTQDRIRKLSSEANRLDRRTKELLDKADLSQIDLGDWDHPLLGPIVRKHCLRLLTDPVYMRANLHSCRYELYHDLPEDKQSLAPTEAAALRGWQVIEKHGEQYVFNVIMTGHPEEDTLMEALEDIPVYELEEFFDSTDIYEIIAHSYDMWDALNKWTEAYIESIGGAADLQA
jgi:hypothetical protein